MYVRFRHLSLRATFRTLFERNDRLVPGGLLRLYRIIMVSPRVPRFVKAWLFGIYFRFNAETVIYLAHAFILAMFMSIVIFLGTRSWTGSTVSGAFASAATYGLAVSTIFFALGRQVDSLIANTVWVEFMNNMLQRIYEFQDALDQYAERPNYETINRLVQYWIMFDPQERATIVYEGRRALALPPQPLFGNAQDWHVPANMEAAPLDWPLPLQEQARRDGGSRRRRARRRRVTRRQKPQPHSILKWIQK
jgi:hypothetical protein